MNDDEEAERDKGEDDDEDAIATSSSEDDGEAERDVKDEDDNEDAIATSSSSEDDGGGEDDGDDEGKDEGKDDGEGQPTGLSRAFRRLVDNVDGLSKAPILAASKTIRKRKEEEKLELEASKAAKKLREEMKKRGHYLPTKKGEDPQRDILEKRLQKTATKGVVQLFNAINTAQKRIRSEDTLGNKAKAAKLGKAGFLAGIRQVRQRQEELGTEGRPTADLGRPAETGGTSGKWDVLKGGFVGIDDTSVRMRDWDAKQGNASGSESGSDSGGAGGRVGPSDSDDDGF